MKSNAPLRFVLPIIAGLALVIGMFWLLYSLVSHSGGSVGKSETISTIDFVRLKKSFDIETRERKPPPELPQKEKSPDMPSQKMQASAPVNTTVNIAPMKVDRGVAQNAGFALSAADGEYLPIVKVAPMYPESAASRGIEGYVLVEFTVTESGATADPVVIESQPKGVFDESAKKAVLRFKYKPRIDNGKPVRVEHIRHVITFKLDKKG